MEVCEYSLLSWTPGLIVASGTGQYKQDISYQALQWAGLDSSAYYLGCYNLPQDWQNNGLVKASTYSFPSNALTRDTCSNACAQKGAKWSAIRDTTCYCGSDWTMGQGYFAPDDFCNRPCSGNASEICGSYYSMSVFNITNYVRGAASSSSSPAGAGYQGCYAESGGKLALQGYTFSDNKLTPEMCKSYCNQLGFSLAGARNGNQCYCDSVFQGGQWLPDSQCSSPCAGNSSQFCGAPYQLSLYSSNATTYGAAQATAAHPAGWKGCYPSLLILNKQAYSDYTVYPSTLTPASCQSTCAYFGYKFAAIWASSSCNCGNQFIDTGKTPDVNCQTPCKSDAKFTCGGGNYIDVYAVNATSAPDTSSLTAQGWLGCYNSPSSGAALADYSFVDGAMTPQLCQTACKQVGNYKFSGVQGSTCNCGNANAGIIQPPSSCGTACPGDSKQTCGATGSSWSFSIYNTTYGNSTAGSTVSGKGAAWTGCYKEASGYRALSGYTVTSSAMTSALCRKTCALRGYSIAGTQYSAQ